MRLSENARRRAFEQASSLISKLTLLVLHFPRLRVIWSRSLHASADIFRALKSNQDEPDPVLAMSIGATSTRVPREDQGSLFMESTTVRMRTPQSNWSSQAGKYWTHSYFAAGLLTKIEVSKTMKLELSCSLKGRPAPNPN